VPELRRQVIKDLAHTRWRHRMIDYHKNIWILGTALHLSDVNSETTPTVDHAYSFVYINRSAAVV